MVQSDAASLSFAQSAARPPQADVEQHAFNKPRRVDVSADEEQVTE